jgi:uncharacterized protein
VPNRLAQSTSPYLLQHRDNPVDWWPWCDEAFAEARRRDVPVLLSVGYSACHWCHVMAHESFEDPAIAELINAGFVAVKVDREERPDVDAIYMDATQAMTGRGGWPMTVFMTAEGRPFYAGTYFPPGAFVDLMGRIRSVWVTNRQGIEEQAGQIAAAIAPAMPGAGSPIDTPLLNDTARRLLAEWDRRDGGFGSAPKFPPSMALEFLLRYHSRTGDPDALDCVRHTCERMARGGMFDHVEGGFARYSVDGQWVVPHFEKMLYDNAQLLSVYAHLWRATGDAFAVDVAERTAGFLLSGFRTADGAFAASIDADSDGHEGAYYAVAAADVSASTAEVFAVTAQGSFERGLSVLQLPVDVPAEALAAARAEVATLRAARSRPDRDDKVVAAWNGLAIGALADAGTLLGHRDWVVAAAAAARHVLDVHVVDGRLRRVSRDGQVGEPLAVLDDHALLASGLASLAQATGEPLFLAAAETLVDAAQRLFSDGATGYYDTGSDAPELIVRPRDLTDNVTPSGTAAMADALTTIAALTGRTELRERASAALEASAVLLPGHGRFAAWTATVGEALAAGPWEFAVVGPAGAARDELAQGVRMLGSPGAVVAVGRGLGDDLPLVAGRGGDEPTIYACRSMVCSRPVTSLTALEDVISGTP